MNSLSLKLNTATTLVAALVFIGFLSVPSHAQPAAEDSSVVYFSRVEGSIGPTVANYIDRSIETARDNNAEALVIELDTPGGLLDATKKIVQAMLQSEVPIVVYVSPEGASAGSAGVFITLASHIAAMAPTTNIGAASPISMGGGQMDTVQQKKLFNYAESYIASIAERRDRNVEWAKSAVRDAKSITADEAIEINVIDIIAQNRRDLLEQMHGDTVMNAPLNTQNATIEEIPISFAESLFRFLFQPQVILILTLIAIYGIIGEISNPGAFVPGIAGAIALILLLYTVAAMPINVAGFALIGLAIILFVTEAFTPTFGIFIGGGGVAFFFGALMLFQDMPPSFQLSWVWLLPATILTVLFFIFIASLGLKAQFGPSRVGTEAMVGKEAEIIDKVGPEGGRVLVDGVYWRARSDQPIEEGTIGIIENRSGLTLKIKPKQ